MPPAPLALTDKAQAAADRLAAIEIAKRLPPIPIGTHVLFRTSGRNGAVKAAACARVGILESVVFTSRGPWYSVRVLRADGSPGDELANVRRACMEVATKARRGPGRPRKPVPEPVYDMDGSRVRN